MTSTEHHYTQQIDEGALIAGRYRLSRWLGLGAMGEVWAARDERLGRDVAVKLVLGDPSTDPQTADRFTREAIAVARINHPNVVAVYDQGEYQRHQFVVMELVTGCNLDELRGGRPMPVGAALAVAVQITRALEAAHEAGVLHRDIKPTNIMVSHDGVVKVLDFGIAGFLQGAGFTERLTRTGADNLGSPAYTAPERIAGGPDDPRSDLYSVGCLLYLLLTGLPPFPADDSLTILHRHLHDAPTPLRRWRPELAQEIDQLVLWLLAKEPGARPASASVVAGRLESLALAYPNTRTPAEATLDDLLGATTVFDATAVRQLLPRVGAQSEPESDPSPGSGPDSELASMYEHIGSARGRDRRQGGARGGGRGGNGSGPAKQSSDSDGFVRTARHRYAPSLLLVLSVAGGLALGVVISRQSTGGNVSVVGAMPTADAPKATHSAPMGAAPTAAGTMNGKNSMSGAKGMSGMSTSSAKASAPGSGTTGAGSSSMTNPAQPPMLGTTPNVTPNAPITPYLRYTAVAAGNGGCVTLAPGQFECTVGRSDGAPVIQPATLTQTGTLDSGSQPFYCQSSGAEYSYQNLHNHWWAWTESAQGTWGWVSAVNLSGGTNDQPEPGLPYCGS